MIVRQHISRYLLGKQVLLSNTIGAYTTQALDQT